MATPTFNSGIDYFGLESMTSNALGVTTSDENRSKQSTSGANLYGDAAVVDSWGETAAPSATYTVVGDITATSFTLGGVKSVDGIENPVCMGGVTISTAAGQAPTVSASGQMVQAGATALRTYTLPPITLSPRHRAQDFLNLCTIKKGNAAADPVLDYGLESVSANFPIEFTTATPKGVLKNYDLHGGMATCDFTMHWYAATKPTIEVAASLTLASPSGKTVTPDMSSTVSKSCPEGGYTEYRWTVSFPLLGVEASS